MELVIRNIQSQQDLNLLQELAKRLGLSSEASFKGTEALADERKKLILAEREQHLNGEGKSFGWNEVKQMASDKTKRNAL